ncbi:hypothetical protein [Bosea sp. CS1GBMeth4]|uniref:hypothetical protein n=1 Tax=Bosea sp. CS1GBMeth4 TaxID=1892849 RepID=UPI001646C157|nr:hypothetical protein [Bosea sp. CS1GBMeth4]
MNRHRKTRRPSDADLRGNPLIGASKGATRAGARAEDFEELAGANTVEGDLENDVNALGGIGKAVLRNGRGAPNKR